VSYQDTRQTGVIYPSDRDQPLYVIKKIIELIYMTALTRRMAVALLVVGIYRETSPAEPARKFFVASAVFAEAMNENDHPLGKGRLPGSKEETTSPRRLEVVLCSTKILGLHHQTPPTEGPRTDSSAINDGSTDDEAPC